MYVYGPSSLANYPASVWERRTFPSQPSVSERGERRRQLTFLDIPGKLLFSLGGSGDSSSKVSHWVAASAESTAAVGIGGLLTVRLCGCAYRWVCVSSVLKCSPLQITEYMP